MARLIIDYPDDMLPDRALWLVQTVVSSGKVSQANGVPHFCWLSYMPVSKAEVITRRKKPGQKSDSLIVRRA
jgi:isoleucyl-tRNA synthetase